MSVLIDTGMLGMLPLWLLEFFHLDRLAVARPRYPF